MIRKMFLNSLIHQTTIPELTDSSHCRVKKYQTKTHLLILLDQFNIVHPKVKHCRNNKKIPN